jgi:hypothetical protein
LVQLSGEVDDCLIRLVILLHCGKNFPSKIRSRPR